MKVIILLKILFAGFVCATNLFPLEDTFSEEEIVSKISEAFNSEDLGMLDTWINRVGGSHRKTTVQRICSSVDVNVRKGVFIKVLASRIHIAYLISFYNLLDDIALYGILSKWTIPEHLKETASEDQATSNAIKHLLARRDNINGDLFTTVKCLKRRDVNGLQTTITRLHCQANYYLEQAMQSISTKEATDFLEALNTQSKDTEPGSPATYLDKTTGMTKKKVQFEWADFARQLLEHKLKGEPGHQEQSPFPLPKSVPFTKSFSETSIGSSKSSSVPLRLLPVQDVEPEISTMTETLSKGDFNGFVASFLQQIPAKRSGVMVAATKSLNPLTVPRILAKLNEHMHVLEQLQKLLSDTT